MTARHDALVQLYDLLADLEDRCGGKRRLAECDGVMGWPKHGVYFFFEDGEVREDGTPRVVRLGTHALRSSGTTLWRRLAQHKGNVGGARPGGGNHRGSIFRLHVGTALLAGGDWPECVRASWGKGATAPAAIRADEHPLEHAVSAHIGAMPILWVAVDDAPGPDSDRGVIEAGTIALLSNYERPPIDPPSAGWLGHDAASERVRSSGLWNVSHVRDQTYDRVLDVLAEHVTRMGRELHHASSAL
jgi:hypothetical protein